MTPRATKVTVTCGGGGGEIDVKRFHMPAVVDATCPICGEIARLDLNQDYLHYPDIGKPFEKGFCCWNEATGDEHEWHVVLQLDVTLKAVEAT